jgi:hypothetical protein
MVSTCGGMRRFIPVVTMVKGGTGVDTGKAYQQGPWCLKDRSEFLGINHLKNVL